MSRTNPSTVRVPTAVESASSTANINIGIAKPTSVAKAARLSSVLFILNPHDKVTQQTLLKQMLNAKPILLLRCAGY
jgi:hypothetical protein